MKTHLILRGPASLAALLGLALLGCNRSHDHSHDGGDDQTAQITVWSDQYEIFAEHRLVATGAATKFVTHVTDLQTLEPRREGPIKFRLALGLDAPIEHVEKAPSRAGIYELAEAQAKSPRELQDAEFAFKSAQARLDAARAVQSAFQQARASVGEGNTSVPAIELKAPIAGVVVAQSGAALGEWVTPDKPLFTVLDAGTVFIEARVPESAVSRLGRAKEASAELPGERGAFLPLTGEGRGRLVFLSPQVDTATRTENAVAIPDSALVEEGGQLVAFVQLSGETFEKREIKAGIRDTGFVQVLDRPSFPIRFFEWFFALSMSSDFVEL